FLTRHYAAGHFLLSGRKAPRTGGVILASASSLHEVTQWIAEDPFCRNRIASYQIVAWEPTMVLADLSPESVAVNAQTLKRSGTPCYAESDDLNQRNP
ncbi:MAG TPA: YciI family protein, partial [Aquabacterium sp.]|nr:YciI family protein [Aquabacterium sp.]